MYAAADGTVLSIGNGGPTGNLVRLSHPALGVETGYAHLSRFDVVPGQEIRRGEVLGYSGATGKVTAPHLHFEVRLGGNPVNPYPYLTRSAMTAQHVQPDLPF